MAKSVKKKIKCPICESKKENVPHMVVTLSKAGNIHVHAPFENEYLMNRFMETIIKEQKKYNKTKT